MIAIIVLLLINAFGIDQHVLKNQKTSSIINLNKTMSLNEQRISCYAQWKKNYVDCIPYKTIKMDNFKKVNNLILKEVVFAIIKFSWNKMDMFILRIWRLRYISEIY